MSTETVRIIRDGVHTFQIPRPVAGPVMHVTTLRGQVGQGACAVAREAGGAVASGTRCGTVSVEGALVLLLYVSLITELIAIARGRYCYVRNDNSHQKGRPLRPIMRYVHGWSGFRGNTAEVMV